jgi:AcrR family transcriptional regulator
MKKQPELTARTRENLMEAFWQIYSATRIEKVTVKDITARAGYNRSTFYMYFLDVYDVLEQIENSVMPNHEGLINHPSEVADQGLHIDTLTKMYEKNKKYYVVLFGENGDPSFQNKFKNYIKATLKQHLAQEGIPDTFEIEFALEFTVSAMIGVLTYWFRLEAPPPGNRLFELMSDLIHHGLMPVFADKIKGMKS